MFTAFFAPKVRWRVELQSPFDLAAAQIRSSPWTRFHLQLHSEFVKRTDRNAFALRSVKSQTRTARRRSCRSRRLHFPHVGYVWVPGVQETTQLASLLPCLRASKTPSLEAQDRGCKNLVHTSWEESCVRSETHRIALQIPRHANRMVMRPSE